jgi:hypothetical protein
VADPLPAERSDQRLGGLSFVQVNRHLTSPRLRRCAVTPLESIDTQLADAHRRLRAALWAGEYAVVATVEDELDGLLDQRLRVTGRVVLVLP